MGKDGEWEWSKNEKHRLRWGGGGEYGSERAAGNKEVML